MATGKEWLSKLKKAELAELAEHLNLKDFKSAKKNDLEIMLEEDLNKNESSYSKDAKVAPFYASADLKPAPSEKKPKQRRQTLKAREGDDPLSLDEGVSTALARTPSRAVALAKRIPLPPSPAVIADRIDAQTVSLRASVSEYLPKVTIPPSLQPKSIRALVSSPTSIQVIFLFLEAWGLRAQILPLRYLTTIPAIPAIGVTWDTPIKIPDMFALLTAAFWGPFAVWTITSVGLPLLGAWLFNFRGGQTAYDPVFFNVMKALVTWTMFIKGGLSGESAAVVKKGVLGGTNGLLIESAVGILAGLYEGVLSSQMIGNLRGAAE